MATYWTHNLVVSLIIFQAVVLLIVLSNTWMIHRIRRHSAPPIFPFVSILVPARNEERTIAGCVRSLLAQDYPAFEVLVLDDLSKDATRLILTEIAQSEPRLRVLPGEPPPADSTGKNWACSQLARQARGEILFFTDADTTHRPTALLAMVTTLIGEHADLLTGFPHQEMKTWGERLLVPFFSWISLGFNPLLLAYRLRLPALTSAVGQIMIFQREAYWAIGGHASIRSSIVEDLALARRIKAAGKRWRLTYAADLVSCRMYQGSQEAIDGFAKNLFAAFDFRLLPFLFAFAWLAVMFWDPIIVLAAMGLGFTPAASIVEPLVCIGMSLLIWLIPLLDLKLPPGQACLYPLTILATEVVALRSLWKSLRGQISWKNRPIPTPRWKWL